MIYAITIYGEDGVFDALPQDRRDDVLSGHKALQDALKGRGPFVTMKLMPPTSAVMIEPAGAGGTAPLITDGPFSETKESFLGFYAADFSDLEEALEYAKMISSPIVRLEVRPVAWADGAITSD